MLNRSVSYGLLLVFAGAMVVLLMLDDPTRLGSLDAETVVLFPDLTRADQIERIEVQDVTRGTGFLLVRDEAGLWYAPQVPGAEAGLSSDQLNQAAVDVLAQSITSLVADRWYDATSENRERFGLALQPAFTFAFAGQDATGRAFESLVFAVGDPNLDNTGRYVWPQGDQRIFLLQVDFLLTMFDSTTQPTPTPANEPTDVSGTAHVP